MQINSDFSKRAVVHGDQIPWRASPMQGVTRRMLDRIGDEVARATTIVRYDAGSSFSAHNHDGGEEFIVLEGVFQDEHGDYPAGTYVRNPPGTRHMPRSDEGCTIMVKLWQFDPDDKKQFSSNLKSLELMPDPVKRGVRGTVLFEDQRELVRFEEWTGSAIEIGAVRGAEYFVLEGLFELEGETFSKNSWLRLPEGEFATVSADLEGVKIWCKTGHLPFAAAPG